MLLALRRSGAIAESRVAMLHAPRRAPLRPPQCRALAGVATPKGAPIGWGALGVMAVCGGGLAVYYNGEKEKRQEAAAKAQKTYGTPSLGGPWTLVDARTGAPVTDAAYRGRYALLYFGFSKCPDICPAELVKVGDVLRRLDAAGDGAPDVKPLFVSLDPRRDSLRQLAHYGADYDGRVDFLVGSPAQCKAAAKAYRVYSSIADEDKGAEDDYLLDHSIVLYLIGPDGGFLDFFTQSTTPATIADKIIARHADRNSV